MKDLFQYLKQRIEITSGTEVLQSHHASLGLGVPVEAHLHRLEGLLYQHFHFEISFTSTCTPFFNFFDAERVPAATICSDLWILQICTKDIR